MTDEGGGNAKGMMGKLSTGEMLVGLGAAWIFVVVYAVGNRIADEYFGSVILMVVPLCLGIVAAIYFYQASDSGSWRTVYPWAVVAAAWGVVVLVALDLLNGIVVDFSSSGEFYEITLYIAAAAMAAGAVQMRSSE